MTEPNPATGTVGDASADGSAKATGTPDATSTGGSADQESVEGLKAKLAERDSELEKERRERERLLSERTRVEEQQRQVDEERRRLAAQSATDANRQNPDLQNLGELDALIATYPNDPQVAVWKATKTNLQFNIQQQYRENWNRQLEQALQGIDEPLRSGVRQKMVSGSYNDFSEAVASEKNKNAAANLAEVERLRKENEELKKDKEARDRNQVSLGGRPAFDARPTGNVKKESENAAELSQMEASGDRAGALKRMREIESGTIKILRGQ